MNLGRDFYLRADTLLVARELLGKLLVVPDGDGRRVSGRVVEAEAYLGAEDRASHAHGGRRTARTETMYARGGAAYVYLVYGLHHQFNVVTGPEGSPHAVLVRALAPVEGIERMRLRRPVGVERALASGPGKLCRALGIDRTFDGEDLTGARVWLEDDGFRVRPSEVAAGPRVGVAYAAADALRPWRFWLRGSPFVSRNK
jgi:DNA-3-methyladenine glycosylase